MRRRLLVILASVSVAALPAAAETLLPLNAQDSALVPPGMIEFTVGAERAEKFDPPFRDFRRTQWAAPQFGVNAGLGSRAEVQLFWEALHVEKEARGGRGTFEGSGTGDARLFTKVRVFSAGDLGRAWIPDTALWFGAKLPNTNEDFGADQTDFFAEALLGRTLAGARLVTHLGIGILGNPGEVRVQDDLFLWGLAAASPPLASVSNLPVALYGEVAGAEGSRFGNDRRAARLGLRIGEAPLSAYAGGSFGFEREGEDYGARIGVIYELRAFSEP